MSMPTTKEINYPESDGKPMAESDVHRDWMLLIIERWKNHFRGQQVYVSGNLLIYYVEGDPRKCIAPDAFAVKDCSPRRRKIFKVWEEKRVPSTVLETTSKTTRREDLGKKKALYAQLGIKEYFLYDPLAEWLKPPLQGFRLRDGNFEPIVPDAAGGLVSEELGIRFVLEQGDLVMYDVATGKVILTRQEQAAEDERQRAEEEKRRAEAEKRRADEERQRAANAEKRIRELEEELARRLDEAKKVNGKRKNGHS